MEGNTKEKTKIVGSKRQNSNFPAKEESGSPPKKKIKLEMKIEPKESTESTVRSQSGDELFKKSFFPVFFLNITIAHTDGYIQ